MSFLFYLQVSTVNVQSFNQPLSFSRADDKVDAMDSSIATSVTGIRGPLGNSFTVILNSGQMLRCSLPLNPARRERRLVQELHIQQLFLIEPT